MPKPKEICLEELDRDPEDENFIRCVALPGGEPGLAVKRFRAVREAVGPDVPIAVDISSTVGTPSHWNAFDALRLIEELNKQNLHLAEQPESITDIDGFKSVKARTTVPLSTDAIADSVAEAYNVIKHDLVASSMPL